MHVIRLPRRGEGSLSSHTTVLEDQRPGVRVKISARWIAMLFLFAYGDIFGFFVPGRIEELMGGRVSGVRSPRSSCSEFRSTSRWRA